MKPNLFGSIFAKIVFLEQQLSHCCRLGREQKSFVPAIYLDWMTLAANLT